MRRDWAPQSAELPHHVGKANPTWAAKALGSPPVTSEQLLAKTIPIAEYARRARDTDELDDKPPYSLDAPFMGLVGEVGSLLSAAKKLARSDRGFTSFRETAREELGDLLWYVTIVCDRCQFDLRDLLGEAVDVVDLATFDGCDGDIADPETVKATAPWATLIELNTAVATLSQTFPACRSEGARAGLRSPVIDVMRAYCAATNQCGLTVSDVAMANRQKIDRRWPGPERTRPALIDEAHGLASERLFREPFDVVIEERVINKRKFVFQQINGINIGDPLTDNIAEKDDYRFHDVFHYAYAAKLGWSPVLRALLKLKRKSDPDRDENQDGARAILIEEGVATMIFNVAKDRDLFAGMKAANTPLPYDLLKQVEHLVRGYEVERTPLWLWEEAILEGFECFRFLAERRRGIVTVDPTARRLKVRALDESGSSQNS